MQFYAAYQDNICTEDIRIFAMISKVVRRLPDLVFDSNDQEWKGYANQVSCHLICRALARYFDVSVHDGYFTPGYQHSWLKTKNGTCVIDVYPVAGVNSFAVTANWPSPWAKLYQESDKFKEKFQTPEFIANLEKTANAVAETILQLDSEPLLQ